MKELATMETITKEAVALKNMFLFATAMPGIDLAERHSFIEHVMAQKDFDQHTFRMNIDLSDAAMTEAGAFVVPGQPDWWVNEFRIGESIGHTLDLDVHLEDGRIIPRVLGVDCEIKRVLGSNGCVYQLGRRLVSPIEVSVSATPKREYISAEMFVSNYNAQELAKKYFDQRHEDAMKFYKSLKWEQSNGYTIQSDIYGVRIVHEMREGTLRAGATWGELFFPKEKDREPIMFHTFEQFVAYMLAKYW
jgi:hypothetical protein